ncbi:MAG: hypothetical protein HUU47_06400 [Bacteroidetes bacterium]|nr:hypothetical protein [Bacteroidota bacterium]
MKFKQILFLGLVILFSSCYYDVEEELYPTNISKCDTTNTKLSTKIKPILIKNCYVCHSVSNSINLGGNIDLETYTELKKYVDNSKLLMSIKHQSGVWSMPKGTSYKIPACDINKIEYWIKIGAKND